MFIGDVMNNSVSAHFLPTVLGNVVSQVRRNPLAKSCTHSMHIVICSKGVRPMSSGRVSFVLTKHGTFDRTFGGTNPGVLRPVCSMRIFMPSSGVNSIVNSLRKHHTVVVNVGDRGKFRGLVTGMPLGRVSSCSATLDSLAKKHTSFVVGFTDCRLIPSSMRSGLVGSFRTGRIRRWLFICGTLTILLSFREKTTFLLGGSWRG